MPPHGKTVNLDPARTAFRALALRFSCLLSNLATAKEPPRKRRAARNGHRQLGMGQRFRMAAYAVRYAVDGKVPEVACPGADERQVWLSDGSPAGTTLSFEWKEPTPVATVVYYGRTSWNFKECWK